MDAPSLIWEARGAVIQVEGAMGRSESSLACEGTGRVVSSASRSSDDVEVEAEADAEAEAETEADAEVLLLMLVAQYEQLQSP
jgi:hypothetical protein